MSIVDSKLAKWLQEKGTEITEKGAINRIRVFHLSMSGLRKIEDSSIAEGSLAQPEYAQAIWDIAEREVAALPNMGSPERFVVLGFRGDPEEVPSDEDFDIRYPFAIKPVVELDERIAGQNSLPATNEGLLANLMRFTNEQQRLNLLLAGASHERMENEIQRLTTVNQMYEQRHFNHLQMEQDLLDRKSERALRHDIEQRKAARMDEAVGMVFSLMPFFFAQLTGGKAISGNAMASTSRDVAMGKMLKNLSEEEVMKIFSNMKMENQIAFMQFYKSYRDEEIATQASKPESLRDGGKTN